MREFIYAAKTQQATPEFIPFTIGVESPKLDENGKPVTDDNNNVVLVVDRTEYTSLRPTEGQLALLLAAMAGGFASPAEQGSTVINFFTSCLEEDSKSRIIQRLMDRNDPFELSEAMDIVEWLVEEWTSRPTQPLSASTQSPESTGPSSTGSAEVTGSTPSRSLLPASAT